MREEGGGQRGRENLFFRIDEQVIAADDLEQRRLIHLQEAVGARYLQERGWEGWERE